MGGKSFREGTGSTQFYPVPFLFSKQSYGNIILVGDDPVQLRFVEQLTGRTCETVETVEDGDLFGKSDALYRVLAPQTIHINPQLRKAAEILSLSPILPGSVAANMLVKVAAGLMEVKLEREALYAASRIIGRAFEKEEIADLRVGLWRTCWLLSGPLPVRFSKEPWEGEMRDWFPPGVNTGLRLGTLFKTLKAYVLVQTGFETEAKAFAAPSKLAYLKEHHLSAPKVRASLLTLSRWKHYGTDDRIAALTLSAIWQQ